MLLSIQRGKTSSPRLPRPLRFPTERLTTRSSPPSPSASSGSIGRVPSQPPGGRRSTRRNRRFGTPAIWIREPAGPGRPLVGGGGSGGLRRGARHGHAPRGRPTLRRVVAERFHGSELSGCLLSIRAPRDRPKNAYVAIPCRGSWSDMADHDRHSKATFGPLNLRFSLQSAASEGIVSAGPGSGCQGSRRSRRSPPADRSR